MAGSIKVTGHTSSAPAPRPAALKPGYYAAPKGVAPGWVIRYEGGVPVGMEQFSRPGDNTKAVGLAPGYMLVVGADGKPNMVKGDVAAASKAQPAAPAADQPAAPADPPRERTKPFLTPDELQQVAAFNTSIGQQGLGLDTALGELTANTGYSLAQNEQNAKVGFSNTNDDAAARGIFQSSIRDGGLADIEAKRATAADQLTTALTRAEISTAAQKKILSTAVEEFGKWQVLKGTENADAVESQILPAASPAPAAPTTTAVSGTPGVTVPAAVNKPAIKAAQTLPTGTTSPVVTGQSAQGSSYTNTGKQPPVKAPTKPKAPVKPKSFNSSN